MASSTAPAATEQEEEFMEVEGTVEEEQKQLEQKVTLVVITSYLLSCTSSLLCFSCYGEEQEHPPTSEQVQGHG